MVQGIKPGFCDIFISTLLDNIIMEITIHYSHNHTKIAKRYDTNRNTEKKITTCKINELKFDINFGVTLLVCVDFQ